MNLIEMFILVEWSRYLLLDYSTNPCNYGFFNHPDKDCVCSPTQRKRYLNRISGPLLDRIVLHVEVTPVSFDEISSMERPSVTSKDIAVRVSKAREIQLNRFQELNNINCNAQMPSRIVREVCEIKTAGQLLVKKAMEKLQLSARAYDRILKVARTMADLSGSDSIKIEHLAKAIHFRSMDREGWAG